LRRDEKGGSTGDDLVGRRNSPEQEGMGTYARRAGRVHPKEQ